MTKDQRAIDTALNKAGEVLEEIVQKGLEGNEQVINWHQILEEQFEVIRDAAKLDIE